MCYNAPTSLSAWALANIASIILYKRNRGYDRWNAAFITTFSTIQLLEAGIWLGGDDDILTRLMLLTLVAQPLVQTGAGASFTKSDFLMVMTWVYLGILLYTLCRVLTAKKGQFSSSRGKGGHMIWTDSKYPNNFLGGSTGVVIPTLYLGGMFVPLLFMKDGKGLPLLLLGMGSAAFSMFIAKPGEFSSLWCFYSVSYALVALLV